MSKAAEGVLELVILALMLALLEGGKRALDFLPNIEVVTLLFMLYAKYFGKKAYLIAVAFTVIETLIFGIQVWVIMYLYMWPMLITIILVLKKKLSAGLAAIIGAFFGLFFGFFCAIPYLFIGGITMAFSWWVAGIPFDIIHCVSNFIVCLCLFKPLSIGVEKGLQLVHYDYSKN